MKDFDTASCWQTLKTTEGEFRWVNLQALSELGLPSIDHLPFSIRVLLESAVRNYDGYQVKAADIEALARWRPDEKDPPDIAFKPGRVVLQDFTGVPCVVDLAAMREALKNLGGDPAAINPQVTCDLVIDHSVQVDAYGSPEAFQKNIQLEFERNRERYQFLKWGQKSFQNFHVVPPGTGIVHQVNLEYLAQGVLRRKTPQGWEVFPDSLVGTDSHTTMINGLGVVGWGVGGIEAEAVMLGEPIFMVRPRVVGLELTGRLTEGVTATDCVLTITELLRKENVVGQFVEFVGEGVRALSLPDRATIANMAPEYGATMGFFPVDDETLAYYRLTGRPEKQVELIERTLKGQGLFLTPETPLPTYSRRLKLDLGSIRPCVAGPKRPQDRIDWGQLKQKFREDLIRPIAEGGFGATDNDKRVSVTLEEEGATVTLQQGSVVIAAITSCTNTSNPSVLLGAGLLARRAVEKGLKIPAYVKTSLAPGSQVVEDYLRETGLLKDLEKLGFYIVGYGCTTCIGNSGPLRPEMEKALRDNDLIAASVLSGNRNFEGRVHPLTRANYLASPPLVIALALAGRVDVDLTSEPMGQDPEGNPVYLKDIWPTQEEITKLRDQAVRPDLFRQRYAHVFEGNEAWNQIQASASPLYSWQPESTYIQRPPFFEGITLDRPSRETIRGARVLVKLGDSVTTDHISPAGAIAPDSPAGRYLQSLGVPPNDFNSYGSRRGNHEVMMRGTFANIRLRNHLAPGTEGSWTVHFPDKTRMSIYDAAMRYQEEGVPCVVLAGKEYGTGSSRDWAAKGPALLGVKVVIAESYERIHRSNLAGMGIVPLQFLDGNSTTRLGLTGEETYDFEGLDESLSPGARVRVTARTESGETIAFETICRLDTDVEVAYFLNGGILQTVLRKLAHAADSA